MEISSIQHQVMANNQVMGEVMLASSGAEGCSKSEQQMQDQRKPRPQAEQALKCPRCESNNTKFCYYNNYSLSQPRYFCKGCRRYWTQGGSLRNVPVGGGCRKNKRSSSTSSSFNSKKSSQLQDHHQAALASNSINSHLLPSLHAPLSYDPSDLTLAPFLLGSNPSPSHSPAGAAGFLDILRSGFLESSAPAGFNNLCSSYGFDGGLLPFEGGLCLNSVPTAAALGTGLEGSSQSNNNNNNNNNNVGVDSSTRDYWNGAGAYNWHGLINSSLM